MHPVDGRRGHVGGREARDTFLPSTVLHFYSASEHICSTLYSSESKCQASILELDSGIFGVINAYADVRRWLTTS